MTMSNKGPVVVAAGEMSEVDSAVKLVKYDAACRALHEARSVDEVKEIGNQAEILRAYARQSKDTRLIAYALEIKMRAHRRLGELMIAQAATIGRPRQVAHQMGFRKNPILRPRLRRPASTRTSPTVLDRPPR
jgi:hypothetical protein